MSQTGIKPCHRHLLRAERRAGELLLEMDKNKGSVAGKTGRKSRPVLDNKPKLSDLGITKDQSLRSSKYQPDRKASKAWAIKMATLRTTGTPAMSAHMTNPCAGHQLTGPTPAQSKLIALLSRNCRRSDDFRQQKMDRFQTQPNGVIYTSQAERGRMARKPISREIVMAAVLDVVLGGVLLAGTVYVAFLCLALRG